MPTVEHSYDKLCLITEGNGFLHHRQRKVPLAPRQVVRIPAHVPHFFADSADHPLALAVFCIRQQSFVRTTEDRLVWRQAEMQLPPCVCRGPLTRYAMDLAQQDVDHVLRENTLAQALAQPMMHAFATQFIVRLMRALTGGGRADEVDTVIAWIDDHFTESFSLADLARRCRIPYRSLTERFRQRTGQTIVQYVTARRVAFARQRILDTGTIASSALDAGFQDLSHFYRVFSKSEGHAPGVLLRGNFPGGRGSTMS